MPTIFLLQSVKASKNDSIRSRENNKKVRQDAGSADEKTEAADAGSDAESASATNSGSVTTPSSSVSIPLKNLKHQLRTLVIVIVARDTCFLKILSLMGQARITTLHPANI